MAYLFMNHKLNVLTLNIIFLSKYILEQICLLARKYASICEQNLTVTSNLCNL